MNKNITRKLKNWSHRPLILFLRWPISVTVSSSPSSQQYFLFIISTRKYFKTMMCKKDRRSMWPSESSRWINYSQGNARHQFPIFNVYFPQKQNSSAFTSWNTIAQVFLSPSIHFCLLLQSNPINIKCLKQVLNGNLFIENHKFAKLWFCKNLKKLKDFVTIFQTLLLCSNIWDLHGLNEPWTRWKFM